MIVEAAQPSPRAQTARMVQLDGLRGIAAFMVVFYHTDIVYRIGGPFGRGYLFVDLFFLLSGFVLAVSTEKKLSAGIGAIEFTWVRYKRLLPLVAVGAGVALVRAVVIGMADPLTLLWMLALDLAMVPSFAGTGPFYRFNGPQWTLFYELLANFVHAAVLHRVPTRWMLALAAAMAIWLVHEVQIHGSDTMGVNAPTWTTWWSALPRVGWSYVLGVWIGRQYTAGRRGPALPWWLALGFPVFGIVLVPILPLSTILGDLLFVLLFLPAIMWTAAMSTPPPRMRPALEWLGNFSLPLYCVHLTVLVWMSELLGRAIWVWMLALTTALLLAWAFSKLVSFASPPLAPKIRGKSAARH
jgi:peptidoglycan/LPS O-acetylase OafA/YrhL